MSKVKTQDQSLKERLGSGLKFPIKGSFEPEDGLELLLQDIQLLLLTVPGERPNRPDFGANLRNQIWENIDQAASKGKSSIRTALNKFEPRIRVTDVSSEINRNTGLITFTIRFIVKSTNSPVNLVFPLRVGSELSFA